MRRETIGKLENLDRSVQNDYKAFYSRIKVIPQYCIAHPYCA